MWTTLFWSLSIGHSEEETQRLVIANFGDPQEIARQFAYVYRRQWAILRLSVFLLSTLAVASLVAAVVMTMQAGVAIGLGVPLTRLFNAHHTMIEAMDILCTAAAYVALISLEQFFEQRRFAKATALLVLCFAIAIASFAIAGVPWRFLLFGLLSGVFLRTIQLLLKNQMARIGVVVACFGLIGLFSLRPLNVASWLVAGLGYQAMTNLAVRVDRALSDGIQQL